MKLINQRIELSFDLFTLEYRKSVKIRSPKTLVLLLKFVTREIKESFVSRTNVLLVGTLISIGDVGLSMVITGLWAPD